MRNHERAFGQVKRYYNEITADNLKLIKSLKVPVVLFASLPPPPALVCPSVRPPARPPAADGARPRLLCRGCASLSGRSSCITPSHCGGRDSVARSGGRLLHRTRCRAGAAGRR